jgi:DNA-binding NarL/FixJ family response regulator
MWTKAARITLLVLGSWLPAQTPCDSSNLDEFEVRLVRPNAPRDVRAALRWQPHWVLFADGLPPDRFRLFRAVQEAAPNARLAVVSDLASWSNLGQWAARGVRVFAPPHIPSARLARLMRMSEESDAAILDMEIASHPVSGSASVASSRTARLSRREAQVLEQLTYGRKNAEIAAHLSLSIPTIELHVRNVLRKLDCRNRTEAATKALIGQT